MMRINGWHRLWILATLILGALIGLVAVATWLNTFEADLASIARSAAMGWIVASAGLLLLGHAAAWVIRGFRQRDDA